MPNAMPAMPASLDVELFAFGAGTTLGCTSPRAGGFAGPFEVTSMLDWRLRFLAFSAEFRLSSPLHQTGSRGVDSPRYTRCALRFWIILRSGESKGRSS